MLKEEIGKRVKELRINNSLSQEELAELAGLDRTYITYVETGKKNVTVETLYKITSALNITLSSFFNFDDKLENKISSKKKSYLELKDLVKDNYYTNSDIASIFKCSTQGGMRVSKRLKSVTLISNFTDGNNPYNDSKINEEGRFIYTGMGLTGDQTVTENNQNGKVAYSKTNGYTLYYFVLVEKNKYKYLGQVKLSGKYYFEDELDKNGISRKVVKFPLTFIL